ncbi:MAG: hypothetical protein M1834_001124 [Cirrosporium novae-zelandiae]|nr:MAG: hypothetical protein M1834_001124 [Cirrosporium novae-zelandiae]
MPSLEIDRQASYRVVTKRRKLDVVTDTKRPAHVGSKIFSPFRTLGLVSSTPVPFTSVPLGKTTFQITTSVGQSLQTYDLRRGLNLVFLTRPQTPGAITATFAWKDRVLAAWGPSGANNGVGVWVFKRGKKVAEFEIPKELGEPIRNIMILGSWVVGCCKNRIEIWKTATYEHYTTLFPTGYGTAGTESLTGAICNLPTFLNKIFVGKWDGSVDIWNVSTGKLVYTILPKSSAKGSVTALQSTPALSLLAIAYSDGSIVIQDARTDTEILSLRTKSASNNAITSISFRTDGLGAGEDGRRAGVMAAASISGSDITIWDLNEGGRIMGVLRGAHLPSSESLGVSGGVNKIEFLPGQPVLVSTGLDNSLKSWVFDETPFSPIPRILHSRSGHAAPVTRLDFLPSNSEGVDIEGKWVMSAGKDRSLWGWSLRKDGQSSELSQGNTRHKAKKKGLLAAGKGSRESLEDLKAPEITCMACSLNRDGGMNSAASGHIWINASTSQSRDATASGATGWESVVTGHKGDKYARTWSWGRKKAGRWAFETGDGTEVKSVAISPCGTFAMVGSSGGSIVMFNLQSGIRRQSFPAKLNPAQAKKLMFETPNDGQATKKFGLGQGKHTKAVTGIVVDGLNRTVISTGLDGKLKFWDFASGILLHEINWYPMTTITGIRYYRPSDLIALSCDDLCIRVVDTETKKLVRELWGSIGQITDFCFSNDGRWIIAASIDSIIRVWDLPTGHLIDVVQLGSACTAMAFSPTGEFLATAHVDNIGINIWNNKTLFLHVPTRQLSEDEIVEITAPTASGEGGQGLLDAAFEDEEGKDAIPDGAIVTIDQLSDQMMTLSTVPQGRWQTLLHLEAIRQRNKPKEAPKAPEKAPFFLSTLGKSSQPAAQPKSEDPSSALLADHSRILKMNRQANESDFTILLRTNASTSDYTPFISHFKTLSPSATDVEIRSLNSAPPYTELVSFITALTFRLRQRRDYELVQAWMAVFLKIHGDVVGEDEADDVVEALREWRGEQKREADRLRNLVGYCGGVVGFLRSARG